MEYKAHQDISIIKYGLQIVSQYSYTMENWVPVQSRLLNIWARFPSLSDRILSILWQNKSILKKNPLRNTIYSIIDEALRLNRDQELVWAVWFIKVFEVQISQEVMTRVLKSSNDLAIIIMLDIVFARGKEKSNGILEQRKQIHEELKMADTDDFGNTNALMWTPHWLLAYEANRHKWLNLPNNPLEYARKTPFFKTLLEKGIKFYDQDFSYPEPTKHNRSYEYVTRFELRSAIRKLKQVIAMHANQVDPQNCFTLTKETAVIYERLMSELEKNESM